MPSTTERSPADADPDGLGAGTTATLTEPRELDLDITGMTCAACSTRIEKKIRKLPGAEATVSLPLNSAHVRLTSPEVGEDEVLAAVSKAGYGATVRPAPGTESTGPQVVDYDPRGLRPRLIGSAILGVPAVAISMVMPWHFPGWHWVVAALALPVVTWGAWPFHTAAFKAARGFSSTMDTLVSVGVGVATLYSLVTILVAAAQGHVLHLPHSSHVWFEAAVAITVFLLLGRLVEERAKSGATEALRALLALGAPSALVVRPDGTHEEVPIDELRAGDVFLVKPGSTVATDGTVLEGASAVDESMLTGESVPVEVGVGSAVTGGTLNTSGSLTVRADRVGANTTLAMMAGLVNRAQASKPRAQRLADRIAAVFVPAVFVIAAVTFLTWGLVAGDWTSGLHAALTVLVIACPCALGLATPTALAVSSGRGSRLGVLVSGADVMESTRRIDTVVLDKTGTLTEGRMVVAAAEVSRTSLPFLAAAESRSEHPVARAVAEYAEAELAAGTEASAETSPLQVQFFENVPGGGVRATIDGHLVLVGRPGLLAEEGIRTPEVDPAHASATLVGVALDGEWAGHLEVMDTVKPTSREALAQMRALGLAPVLLTGDREAAAREVARALGIDEVRADVRPADKEAVVAALQESGRVVAMVGDGVNDAAALARADLGIAMGSGTDAAIAASDITLMRSDPAQIPQAVRLSRRTLGIIKGNLFWAFVYNVAAIPVAAFGLLDPMLAGLAMAFSSVFVVLNSLRLLRFE
ncbi:cation-translocating P-type ATPase [Brevibacterium samyangense]|uniref:Heavy metal translocating P-type ATPase n=1 Tax=Brevibacterium samyangense TaxID=366888 RepID=A0ABN2T4Z6_9MICO